LVVTTVSVASGLGALFGGCVDRRTSRSARALMVGQALRVVSALLGLSSTSADALDAHRGRRRWSTKGPATLIRRAAPAPPSTPERTWTSVDPRTRRTALPSRSPPTQSSPR